MQIDSPYTHLHNHILYELLLEPEFASALAYLVDYKNHPKLIVTAHPHSIELKNNEISISIILYSGFELDEYEALKNNSNRHLICLSEVVPEMVEFKNMHVKYIDKFAWLFSIITRSNNKFVNQINRLKNLNTY